MDYKQLEVTNQVKRITYGMNSDVIKSTVVIGIGNCGTKILNSFMEIEPRLLSIAISSNLSQLANCSAIRKIMIRDEISQSYQEVNETLQYYLQCAENVYLVSGPAGFSGNTLTIPITEIVHDIGINTNVIAIEPFTFEGKERYKRFFKTIDTLRTQNDCDSILCVKNDSLIVSSTTDSSIEDSYQVLNLILLNLIMGKISNCVISDASTHSVKPLEQGSEDIQSILDLARQYAKGNNVNKDQTKALELYKQAAQLNSPEAMFYLGVIYNLGDGVQKDISTAIYWYKKAAELGIMEAAENLAFIYDNGQGVKQDYSESIEWYERAAQLGSSSSMFNLGYMYSCGQGIPQNVDTALKWYAKAAELGSTKAMFNMGRHYECGKGVDQDFSVALQWYTKAADLDDTRVINYLADIYHRGLGVVKDDIKAFSLYKKAAELGDSVAMFHLGTAYYYGQGTPSDNESAVIWYERAAELNNTNAMVKLAHMYVAGIFLEKNILRALELFEEAGNLGNRDGLYNAGLLYLEGQTGIDIDIDKAISLLKKAESLGDHKSHNKLNEIKRTKPLFPKTIDEYEVLDDEEIPIAEYECDSSSQNANELLKLGREHYAMGSSNQDYEQAATYFEKAAEHGSSDAMLLLAYMYEIGEGVEQNASKAIILLKKSANLGNINAMERLVRNYNQGTMYYHDRSIHWCDLLSNSTDSWSINNLGDAYFSDNDPEQDYSIAIKLYERAAELGNIDSILSLAEAYKIGLGVQQDITIASSWYEKAAQLGDDNAKLELNSLLSQREAESQKQYEYEIELYHDTLSSNSASEMYKLANEFLSGDNMIQNSLMARKLYEKASKLGHIEATKKIQEMYATEASTSDSSSSAIDRNINILNIDDVELLLEIGDSYFFGEYGEANPSEAFAWYKKSAELGNARAMFNVGLQYYRGDGIEQDYVNALHWVEKAAEMENANAIQTLGAMYHYGDAVEQNDTTALHLFKKAAAMNQPNAMLALGNAYYFGWGVDPDYTIAAQWYMKSAELGIPTANYNLGVMYKYGQGVEQNDDLASEYFERASDSENT